MTYPLRAVHKDSILVKPVWEQAGDIDHTGITTVVWTHLEVTNITDTGVYIIGSTMFFPTHINWDQLPLYRILIVRRGASRKPGRRWEVVERHYLHKISVHATIEAYGRAWKTQDDPAFVRPPRASDWKIR